MYTLEDIKNENTLVDIINTLSQKVIELENAIDILQTPELVGTPDRPTEMRNL